MLDAATAYPMLKRRRRRRERSATGRAIAALLIVAAALMAGGWWWTRPAPVDARAALVRALAALAAGNATAARAAAEQAVAAQPSAGAAQAVLARADLELDDGVAAEAALTRAVAAGFPAARLHQLFAQARLLQDDPDGAMADAAKAAPRYAGYAARIRARALAASGQPVAARDALAAIVEGAPENGEAWLDLGRLQLTQGDLGGASASASRAVRLLPGSPRALTLAAALVRARFGPMAALPWFEAALRRDPSYFPALVDYAATLGEVGRNADLLAAARRAQAVRPAAPEPFYLQAVLAARAGERALAERLLEQAGDLPATALVGGGLDYAAGRYQQAAVRWQAVVDGQPMNLGARRLLAAALLRAGDASGARDVLRPLVLRGDADTHALLLAARASEAVGDRAVAALLLDRAAGAGGRAASSSFASDQGLDALRLGAVQAPTDPTYAIGLIRGLLDAGDRTGATARARALAGAAPGAPSASIAAGDVAAVTGSGGAADYARAADLRFDEPTMLRLVDAQARAGRAREAAGVLSAYLAQNPQSLAGRRLLGDLQVRSGEWAAAIETLEGVRRQVGNADAGVLIGLATAYAGDGGTAVALRYARAAYALQPMNAAAADAYGVALAAGGDRGGARQLLDKAAALAPGDRTIAAHRRALG